MNVIRHPIFIVVVFGIPAVFCATNSTQAKENKKIPESNFNAIDELTVTANRTTEMITEVISKIEMPPENPYETIERHRILTELQEKIIVIKQENEQLEATKIKLIQNCDNKLEQLTEAYNAIMGSLDLDMPEIQLWERRLQSSMLTRELVIKAISEASAFVGFLELKKVLLIGDMDLLGLRESQYQLCREYRRLLTVEPGVSDVPQPGVKTDGIGLRSMSGADVSKTLFERKRILLDVKLEQESNVNRELRKYIKFYAGFCSRSVDSLKVRIEYLRRYPTGEHSLDKLKGEVTVIETEVVEKKGHLGLLKEDLLRLVAEVQELQMRYDSLQEATDCFLEVERFHVDGTIALLSESIVAAEQHTYQEVLNERQVIQGLNPGFAPAGPAVLVDPPLNDSESVEVSEGSEEYSGLELSGLDSRQQQEQIIQPNLPLSAGLKLP